ncbi:MAG: hypothetical protein ACLT4C_03525 [Butyricicoccus sp.]
MLKLLKYEWKACARTCLPLYGVLILMSLISRILYVIPKNASLDFMLPAIGSMLYMGVMMAAFVVTAVILIQRFYKNLLGSGGYLMFTLPVTVTQHLLSKTIIAVVMIGLSGLSALISIFIFADMSFGTLFVDMIKGVARSGGLLFGLELLVLAVLGIADMALFVLYVHGARPSGGQAPPADVGRLVCCSFYGSAGPPAYGDDGRGQCHAGGACRCDGTLA